MKKFSFCGLEFKTWLALGLFAATGCALTFRLFSLFRPITADQKRSTVPTVSNSVYSSREQLDGAEKALKEEPSITAGYIAKNGTPCKTSLCIIDAMTHDRFKVEAVPKKVK